MSASRKSTATHDCQYRAQQALPLSIASFRHHDIDCEKRIPAAPHLVAGVQQLDLRVAHCPALGRPLPLLALYRRIPEVSIPARRGHVCARVDETMAASCSDRMCCQPLRTSSARWRCSAELWIAGRNLRDWSALCNAGTR